MSTNTASMPSAQDVAFFACIEEYNRRYNNAAYTAAADSFHTLFDERTAEHMAVTLQNIALHLLGSPYHKQHTHQVTMTPEAVRFLTLFT